MNDKKEVEMEKKTKIYLYVEGKKKIDVKEVAPGCSFRDLLEKENVSGDLNPTR